MINRIFEVLDDEEEGGGRGKLSFGTIN